MKRNWIVEVLVGALIFSYLFLLWQASGMTFVSFVVAIGHLIYTTLFKMTIFKFPVLLMFLHFLGDFVFQSNTMAQNKSTSWKWLLAHTGTYGAVLSLGLVWFVSLGFLWKYVLVNVLLHTYIDSITSKIAKKHWAAGRVHQFFVTIGFDQFLHFASLYATFWWLV